MKVLVWAPLHKMQIGVSEGGWVGWGGGGGDGGVRIGMDRPEN